MKLTFSDSPNIDELTFKRLMLLGNELIFVERPSCIQLADNFGTVGSISAVNNLLKDFQGSPIKLIVEEPPTSPDNSEFYQKYFEKDMENPEFLKTIFEGIEKSWIYDYLFDISKDKTFGEYKDYKKWLLTNQELIKSTDLINIPRPDQVSKITNKEEALFAFKIIVSEKSLRVTSIIHICNKYNSNPTSINPYLNNLIALRLSNDIYIGKHTKTRQLGLKLMDCIIPDEALKLISLHDLLDFREKTKDYFDNWSVEINKLESLLFKDTYSISDKDIINLFDTELNPRLKELKNEIRRIKDERFKNILKTIKNTLLSGISFGTLSSLSVTGAIVSFIGANLKTPQLTDDIIEAHFRIKDMKLSDGLTYLLKLQELSGRQ
jgi:hypothetical protein